MCEDDSCISDLLDDEDLGPIFLAGEMSEVPQKLVLVQENIGLAVVARLDKPPLGLFFVAASQTVDVVSTLTVRPS